MKKTQERSGIAAGLAVALAGSLFLETAGAQDRTAIEKISIQVTGAFERGAVVTGELRIPDSRRDRLAAVLIVNSTPGFDGRGAFYADALTQSGIATLEVDMLQGRGVPATPVHNMSHAFQSLRYLAAHPRIDPVRIGIMGFSYGGMISLVTSSDELARQYSSGGLRFAAHLGLYPICWRHHGMLAGRNDHFKPGVYQRVTGKPVHILGGDADGYDGADGCRKFLAALPVEVRPHFSLTLYPGATFAWDSRFGSAVYEKSGNRSKGGIVTVIADAEIANRSRDFAVSFFRKNLGAD